MKIVVLFGAGASFGSSNISPAAPPLGGGLFKELKATYPQSWGDLPPGLQRTFADDFEQGMLLLADRKGDAIPPLMQDMTEYFASFSVDRSGQDEYSRLLAGVPNEALGNVLFSTLNYECLLEHAAALLGLEVAYWMGSSLPPGAIRIWKLHGSCNFCLRSPVMEGPGLTWEGLAIDGPIREVQPREVLAWVRGGTALYGAMCLFTVHKPAQIGATSIGRLQQAWSKRVLDADEVIVIGTRYHREDKHLWHALTATPAIVHFVGSRASFDEWQPTRSAGPLRFLGSRFGEVLPELQGVLATASD